jgi:hypothetical protein
MRAFCPRTMGLFSVYSRIHSALTLRIWFKDSNMWLASLSRWKVR